MSTCEHEPLDAEEIRKSIPGHPRSCAGVHGPVYSLDQCRLCWRAKYDPHWTGHSRIHPKSINKPTDANPLDCVHRGLVAIGSTSCGCASGVRTPVYSCAVAGCCRLDQTAADATVKLNTGRSACLPVAQCSKCDKREASTPLPNPPIPTIANYPPPQIGPVRRVRLDESQWPTADRHFQLSVMPHNGKLYSAHRMRWSRGRVVLSELDQDYQIIRSAVARHPQLGVNWAADEDPRLFRWRGKLWLYWTAWDSRSTKSKHNSTTPCVSRVNDDLTVSDTAIVSYGARRGWEKNWGFFSWDDGRTDRLFAVYQPAPTMRVIELDDWRGRLAVDHPVEWPASLGLVRGGASPCKVGDELWCVGHAVYRTDKGRQYYAASLYAMESRPPFKPLRYLPFPLLDPRTDERAKGISLNEAVVFPCGAYHDAERDRLVCSVGWHDRWAEVWEFDLDVVGGAMVPFPGRFSEPNIAEKAVEYGAAIARWVAAGRPERNDREVERILATCEANQCGQWRGDHCGDCGCPVNRGEPLENKARMGTETCPRGFWA